MGLESYTNYIYVRLILHRVCYHNNVCTLVVPNLVWVFMSNQYADDIDPIQNPGCRKNNQSQGLLECNGSTSILFDGVIGGHYQMMKVYCNITHGDKNSYPNVACSCLFHLIPL